MEINSKKLDELYKEWSGEYHTTNSNKQVHDSAECTDFAEYCLKWAVSEGEMTPTSESNCNIPDVVHSKTPKKIAVVGCGGVGIAAARLLANKGVETIVVGGIENSPLELKHLNLPDVEPMIIKQTIPDDYFNKPQNRVDRRKKARSKRKKKNR